MAKTSKTASSSRAGPGWWGRDSIDLSVVDVEGSITKRTIKESRFRAGSMVLFRNPIFVKVIDSSVISAVDENGKVCVRLAEDEYDFLHRLEEAMIHQLLDPKMKQSGSSADVKRCVMMSEGTGLPYLKSKIQTLGYSRTTGIDVDGKEQLDVASLLQTQGSVGDFLLRVEGIYLTQSNCGVLMKVDMLRMKSVPSEKDQEEQRKRKEDDMKKVKEKRMLQFMGGDEKRAKK